MTRFFTGVGSRETPLAVQETMSRIAHRLARKGWVLRSGHAPGADQAFEHGAVVAGGDAEIYLPWKGFEGSSSPRYGSDTLALELARRYHPAFDWLNQGAQKLMARNGYQVLGRDLKTPSEFLVCWTPDGCRSKKERTSKTGGTGQAIAIASDYGIPVFNLFYEEDLNMLRVLVC